MEAKRNNGVGADLKASRRVRRAEPEDRHPPCAPEAEAAVLGCCLLAPNECVPEAQASLRDGGAEFYDLRHKSIWEAILSAFAERPGSADMVGVRQKLKDAGLLEACGGVAYLASLPETVPSTANLPHYLEIVLEKHTLRKLREACLGVLRAMPDFSGTANEFADMAERDILAVRRLRPVASKSAKDLVKSALDVIERKHQSRGAISGLATGFTDLDKLTDGLHPGEMTVLAGFTSGGKTALAMNIVERVSVDAGLPVAVFSMEMSGESLMLRMLCSRSRVNMRSVGEGFLAERDFPKLTGAAGRLAKAPVFVDDASDATMAEVRAKARRLSQQHGLKLVVVDYLQLVDGGGDDDNREQEVSAAAKGFKAMAGELGVPVLVLSQLNDDGRLRESRAIGMHANNVWKLRHVKDRDDQSAEDEPPEGEQNTIPVELVVTKQRNGPTGVVQLMFLRCYTRFENASRVSDNDVPN